MGKKILCFFFEPVGASELSFVLTGNLFFSGRWLFEKKGVVSLPEGNTWTFRDDLERAGISGSRTEANGYNRFLKNVDITDPEVKQQILGIVDILHKQACRVVVDPAPEAESPVANFLNELRSIDSLHFDDAALP